MNQLPALVKDLQNADPAIRLDAVDTFAQLGFVAVQSLQSIARQREHPINSHSLTTLSELSDDAIHLVLEPFAEKRLAVYSSATESFQEIIDFVISALSYSLADDHWKVRHRAMEALWQVGTPEANEALDSWDIATAHHQP